MFEIYGGATSFTQWSTDQKLIMEKLSAGADVHFFNDPVEDDPIITETYEYIDESGNKFMVCDVPNILLTKTAKIKVYVPNPVTGAFGTVYKITGPCEKCFEVEAAEKPPEYVYEETPTKGCGCESSGGEVSDEQIQAAVDKYMEDNAIATVPDGGYTIYAEFID